MDAYGELIFGQGLSGRMERAVSLYTFVKGVPSVSVPFDGPAGGVVARVHRSWRSIPSHQTRADENLQGLKSPSRVRIGALKIGIFGGTGDLGGGLALRLSRRNDVFVGSRDAGRAKSVARELTQMVNASAFMAAGEIEGATNVEVVEGCEMVAFAVPADTLEGFLESAKEFPWKGQIVLSPVTRFEKAGGTFAYRPFSLGGRPISAAELVQETLGEKVRVVSGLHCVPAARLKDLADPMGFDVPLAGPRDSAAVVAQVLEGIEGLRPLFAGPLAVSASLEALTPLLLNIAVRNKLKEPGFRVVG